MVFFRTSVTGALLAVVMLIPACSGTTGDAAPSAPSGLMCELMLFPGRTPIVDPRPDFGWTVRNGRQSAWRILVASDRALLDSDTGDMWDSGRVESDESVHVEYGGAALGPETTFYWKVRTWDGGEAGPWSDVASFTTGRTGDGGAQFLQRYPLVKREVAPARVTVTGSDGVLVDFGRAAFGTVRLTMRSDTEGKTVEVHLGEVLTPDGSIDRDPGGTRRYRAMTIPVPEGTTVMLVTIPPDERNIGPHAVRMPPAIGEVMPFRYCELHGDTDVIDMDATRQVRVSYHFDDSASSFACTDTVLTAVWDLCKYSIRATSFAGLYVDGDRERIPYEADAYINQLSHYGVDREYTLARATADYLMTNPTWPTEWIMHSVLIAWADFMYTGDDEFVRYWYDDLKAKTLHMLAREDGLISTTTGLVTDEVLAAIHLDGTLRDIVDWPAGGFGGDDVPGERDGYVMTDINTVVNAFHYRSLVLMGRIAAHLGRDADARFFDGRAAKVYDAVNSLLLDPARGIYVDGEDTDHASLHANMFPLAFGLVPGDRVEGVVDFIGSRGMACSVYGSQYLLEGLFDAGADEYAVSLMTSTGERSWAHMIYDVGSTITLEAWDNRFKPNQDWNHAWGAAPANIIPRFVLGVRPLEPGFRTVLVKPQTGGLSGVSGKVPTIRGPVTVSLDWMPGRTCILRTTVPGNTRARVMVPAPVGGTGMLVDGEPRTGVREGGYVVFDDVGPGEHVFGGR